MGYHAKPRVIIFILFAGIFFSFYGDGSVSNTRMKELQKKLDIQKHIIYEQLKNFNETMNSQVLEKEFMNFMLLKQELEQVNTEEKQVREEKNKFVSVFFRFDYLKGKLPLPVSGPIVRNFGNFYDPQKSLFTLQKGITIKSTPGAAVQAVADGKVVFSGPLKNYGLIVIVEHPGQYYSLYGQLGRVVINDGKMVKLKEVVGTASEEPFYFELRKKNVAVNPLQWFINI